MHYIKNFRPPFSIGFCFKFVCMIQWKLYWYQIVYFILKQPVYILYHCLNQSRSFSAMVFSMINTFYWLIKCADIQSQTSQTVAIERQSQSFESIQQIIFRWYLWCIPLYTVDFMQWVYYEWAKRTKFLLAVIYGSPCRH